MHQNSKRAAIVAILLGAGACRDTDAAPAVGLAWQSVAAPSCSLTSVASSGPDLTLTRVEGLDVDSRGRIYLADPRQGGVRVLAPDGQPLRTIGRPGRGPGEFKYVRSVQILPGDSLLVYDVELYRLSVFAPDSGKIAYDRNLASTSTGTPPNWVEKLPGQRALFATHRKPYVAGARAADDHNRTQAVRLLEWDGRTRQDSVLVLPVLQPLIVRNGGAVGATSNPFARPGLVRLGPDGKIYYGWGDSIAIAIHSLDGQQVGGFSLPFAGPGVTNRDVDAATEDMDKVFGRALRKSVPERWPAFRSFVVDDEGRIWLGLLAPNGQPTRWTAFSETGAPICSAALPANVDVRLIRGGKAYAVATDEADVPQIQVYSGLN